LDFTAITLEILKGLADFAGNYGFAIILLTIIIRVAMWPLSVSQQKSMKKMQTLSPKMKEIQNRYKNDPQVMQKKMMEFYKEHQFNPFGGCFPLLIQMPVFILLYGALMSPQFIQEAGDSSFLFINRLDSTIKSHAGVVKDGQFGVDIADTFSAPKEAKVFLKNGETTETKINNPQKAIQIQGELIPGKPVDLKISLDSLNMSFDELEKVEKAEMPVINNSTKEVEEITFKRKDSILYVQVPTVQVKTVFHYDVLVLVLLFGLTMYLSQKILMATGQQAVADPSQQAMQQSMANIMPIMITAMFVFFPVPAGVLLYMVTSNVIQVVQTFLINKQIDLEEQIQTKKAETVKNK